INNLGCFFGIVFAVYGEDEEGVHFVLVFVIVGGDAFEDCGNVLLFCEGRGGAWVGAELEVADAVGGEVVEDGGGGVREGGEGGEEGVDLGCEEGEEAGLLEGVEQ
ncbi:MAG: hypothetical protein Q9225_006400, partial [Loekoesia sp. 1 TL-2023]